MMSHDLTMVIKLGLVEQVALELHTANLDISPAITNTTNCESTIIWCLINSLIQKM